jgi:RNA polymerase sigma factor (sigma-70 family)
MNDADLLAQYRNGSQQAFTELVHRHAGWIYSVARRRVGDGHLAEDVAQAVFILLAQKAWKIRPSARLQPWLLKVTCYVANHALRSEQRRRRHERQALPPPDPAQPPAHELADLLDQSLRSLARKDQQALLLRFYRQLSLADVGREMNLTEEAARKRVSRAILRLKKILAFQGFSIAPALLPQWLDQHAVVNLPPHLTAAASSAALAGSSGAGPSWAIAQGVNRMFMWSKIRVAALVCALILLPAILALTHLHKSADAQSDSAANSAADQLPPAMQPDSGTLVQSRDIVLVLSDDARHIWAFSTQSGQWSQPKMAETPKQKIVPTIDNDVAVFCAGDRVYGYVAKSGTWDSFQVPPGVIVEPSVGNNRAMVNYGSHYWVLSTATGRWQGIDTNATP